MLAYLIIRCASLLAVRSSTNRERSWPLRERVRSDVYRNKSSQHEDLENAASQAGRLVLRTSRVTEHDDEVVVDVSRTSNPQEIPSGTANYSPIEPTRAYQTARTARASREFIIASTVSIVQSTEMVGV